MEVIYKGTPLDLEFHFEGDKVMIIDAVLVNDQDVTELLKLSVIEDLEQSYSMTAYENMLEVEGDRRYEAWKDSQNE